jgi:hypothetical protein
VLHVSLAFADPQQVAAWRNRKAANEARDRDVPIVQPRLKWEEDHRASVRKSVVDAVENVNHPLRFRARRLAEKWHSLSDNMRVAVVGGMFAVVAALVGGLLGLLHK